MAGDETIGCFTVAVLSPARRTHHLLLGTQDRKFANFRKIVRQSTIGRQHRNSRRASHCLLILCEWTFRRFPLDADLTTQIDERV